MDARMCTHTHTHTHMHTHTHIHTHTHTLTLICMHAVIIMSLVKDFVKVIVIYNRINVLLQYLIFPHAFISLVGQQCLLKVFYCCHSLSSLLTDSLKQIKERSVNS